MLKKIVNALVLMGLLTGASFAQNIETSPLSRYAFGTLQNPASVSSKGMGGVGIALRDNSAINLSNPASLAALDSLHFVLDVGLTGQYSMLRSGDLSKNTLEGNLDYMAFKMPLFKVIGFSAGLKPFSRSGYGMTIKSEVEGLNSVELTQTYRGKGSMQELFFSLGTDIYKGLSIGAEAHYLFGSTSQIILANFNSSVINSEYFNNELKLSTWYASLGMQYQIKQKSNSYTIGATFTPSFNNDIKRTFTNDRNFGDPRKPDLVVQRDVIHSKIPMSVGLGFAYGRSNKLLAAFDIKYTNWKGIENDFSYQNVQLKDAIKFALGASYLKDPYSSSLSDRLIYRCGVNYASSYFSHNLYGEEKRAGLALGLGVPIYVNNERTSYLNLSLEYEKSFSANQLMIKEDLLKLSLSVNFNETWFRKLKIY